MPKVLLTEPVPRALAQRLQSLLPTGVAFDMVPTLEDVARKERLNEALDKINER